MPLSFFTKLISLKSRPFLFIYFLQIPVRISVLFFCFFCCCLLMNEFFFTDFQNGGSTTTTATADLHGDGGKCNIPHIAYETNQCCPRNLGCDLGVCVNSS